jgi:hypothetical protein
LTIIFFWPGSSVKPSGADSPFDCDVSVDADAPSDIDTEKAEQWLSAVADSDIPTALARAKELCATDRLPMPNGEYVALAESQGVSGDFLTGPFNRWDFELWSQALFINRLGRQLSDDPDNISALFKAVTDRINPSENARQFTRHPPWPYWIWKAGSGLCDRQAWLLSALAYQRGWETQVIYMVDPQTRKSPHTVCELRKGDRVWFADPFKKVLLENTSIDDVAENAGLITKMWPEHEDIQRAFQGCIFLTPSYPQGYCPRNQVLYRRLSILLKDRCPRFAADPLQRREIYRNLRETTEINPRFTMVLWDYPFRLLCREMAQAKGSKSNG